MAFRPWVIKHNLHHAETNIVESDPDIQHPLLAFTEEAAREKRGWVRWLVRYQAYAYPVLAFFATLGLWISADLWRTLVLVGVACSVALLVLHPSVYAALPLVLNAGLAWVAWTSAWTPAGA